MTAHTIHQAAGTNGHRPMSLLLQALKQIEAKSPAEVTTELPALDADRSRVAEFSAAKDAMESPPLASSSQPCDDSLTELPPVIVAGVFEARPHAAERESTIQVIRHYNDGETVSEVAVATPVELPTLALIASDRPQDGHGRRSAGQRQRLADELVQLLPDESRAVVAVVAVDGSDVSQLLFDVCEGLAARDAGSVLAIACHETYQDHGPAKPTFAHAVSGGANWHDALQRQPYDGFASLERGDVSTREPGFQRRLIRLWEEIGREFPFVVIDATAREADQVVPLVATCDAAFLAVRLHETNRHDAEHLISRIRSSGCHPCGCLVAG